MPADVAVLERGVGGGGSNAPAEEFARLLLERALKWLKGLSDAEEVMSGGGGGWKPKRASKKGRAEALRAQRMRERRASLAATISSAVDEVERSSQFLRTHEHP